MSNRLQVLIAPELNARLQKAADRNQVSKGEFVRRALEDTLERSRTEHGASDAVSRLASLHAPTGNIDQMLEEIEAGRG